MKKLLLSAAMALTMSLSASAQFADGGVKVWDGNNNVNYGYTVETNSDGVTYAFFHKVQGAYPMVIYVVDKDGNILTDADGLLLSNEANKSWTVIGQDLTIDVNGNAIVSVLDQRLGADNGESYTIYKVSPEGKLVWGDKMLNNGEPTYASCAGMRICPTSDGGAIFAYMVYSNESGIKIEKLDKDGNSVWQESITDPSGMTTYSYPYLVDAGENQAILFFAEGASNIVKARLIDMDGSSAWGEDITCYKEGFGSMPMHLQFGVGKGPEGAVFGLQTESGYSNYENRMCYILKDDGSFAFSDGEGGTVVSNDNANSRQVPRFYWDDEAQAFYSVFRIYNQGSQNWCGIYMQKLSAEGELLWGADGKAIVELQDEMQVLQPVITNAPEGKAAVFYQSMDGHGFDGKVKTNLVIVDSEGNMTNPIDVTDNDETKNDLAVSPLLDGNHWIVTWSETIDSDHKNVFIQWVNIDGTTTDIIKKTVEIDNSDRTSIFSLDGRRLNEAPQHGVYIENGKTIVKK